MGLETTRIVLTHEHYEEWSAVLQAIAAEQARHKRSAGQQSALRDMAAYFDDKARRARVLAGVRTEDAAERRAG